MQGREPRAVLQSRCRCRYEHILTEPDPVPAYALKLLVAMTEHSPAFCRYPRSAALSAPRGDEFSADVRDDAILNA